MSPSDVIRLAGSLASLLLAGLLACSSPAVETAPTAETSTTWYSVIERAEAMVVCMRAEGVNAALYEESYGIGYPDNPAAEAAYNECSQEIDRTMPFPVLSVEESYEAWLKAADCLRGHGIDVPAAPSLEVWREEGNENWQPYTYVPGESFWAIHEQCPQPGLGLESSNSP